MAHMWDMMAAMRRAIDALTQQLANQESGGGKDRASRESHDMPAMRHKDVDKPSEFGTKFETWSTDWINFLCRKNAKWKGILQAIQNVSQKLLDASG